MLGSTPFREKERAGGHSDSPKFVGVSKGLVSAPEPKEIKIHMHLNLKCGSGKVW